MLRAIGSKRNILTDQETEEYYTYIEGMVDHEVFLELRNFIQHGTVSRYQHSINVSYYTYILCKYFGWDARSAARAGLLHDLFLYDWKTRKKPQGEKPHAWAHPHAAYATASQYFPLNDCEKDIILKHMWPLSLAFPKYKETFAIILVDKYCAAFEYLLDKAQKVKKDIRNICKRHG